MRTPRHRGAEHNHARDDHEEVAFHAHGLADEEVAFHAHYAYGDDEGVAVHARVSYRERDEVTTRPRAADDEAVTTPIRRESDAEHEIAHFVWMLDFAHRQEDDVTPTTARRSA